MPAKITDKAAMEEALLDAWQGLVTASHEVLTSRLIHMSDAASHLESALAAASRQVTVYFRTFGDDPVANIRMAVERAYENAAAYHDQKAAELDRHADEAQKRNDLTVATQNLLLANAHRDSAVAIRAMT